jgi:hypothetical protein
VASIVAQQVFSDIRRVALSSLPLSVRRLEAASRINQFKADLAAAAVSAGVRDRLKESLRRTLQRTATQHDLGADQTSVYAKALDALGSQAR